jgi:hypothetical protein
MEHDAVATFQVPSSNDNTARTVVRVCVSTFVHTRSYLGTLSSTALVSYLVTLCATSTRGSPHVILGDAKKQEFDIFWPDNHARRPSMLHVLLLPILSAH